MFRLFGPGWFSGRFNFFFALRPTRFPFQASLPWCFEVFLDFAAVGRLALSFISLGFSVVLSFRLVIAFRARSRACRSYTQTFRVLAFPWSRLWKCCGGSPTRPLESKNPRTSRRQYYYLILIATPPDISLLLYRRPLSFRLSV